MTVCAADSIYVNGKIVTVDAEDSIVSALAIKDGKILAVGSDAEIGSWRAPPPRWST